MRPVNTTSAIRDNVKADIAVREARHGRRSLLSVITPAYNEERNLPILYELLCRVLDSLDVEWEWIVMDDHSADGTFATLGKLADRDPRVHGVRLARNFGSHTALTCGLHHA